MQIEIKKHKLRGKSGDFPKKHLQSLSSRPTFISSACAASGGIVNARRVSQQRPLRVRQDFQPPLRPELKKERIMMRPWTRPVIIDQADLPWEGWEDADVAARSAIRWKLLTAGERTESAGLVTGIAEIPAGERLLLHHHGPEETYYIVQGRGRMEIEDRAADVGPGFAAYIPPNARHTLRCTGSEPLILVFSFARDRFDQVDYHFDE